MSLTDKDALDKLATWFIENTDEDGYWGSAADFIEFAAQTLAETGRETQPAWRVCDGDLFVMKRFIEHPEHYPRGGYTPMDVLALVNEVIEARGLNKPNDL